MTISFRRRPQQRKLSALEKQMLVCESYDEWLVLAAQHDLVSGAEDWRHNDKSSLYDYANIKQRLSRLREFRRAKDDQGLLFALNEGIHGNMGGMGNSKLHVRAKCGTKHLIEDYVHELSDALEYLAPRRFPGIPLRERVEFFERASHCYGHSALMLSGGGMLGYFHLGVLKALIEQDLLPQVISGASAGSFVAAIAGTHTDDEFLALFADGEIYDALTENYLDLDFGFGKSNVDMNVVKKGIARLVPDLTFEEAYKKTGRSINISVSPAEPRQTSRLLNHIASPNVTIRSAVLASTALPGVFQPVQLEARNVHNERQPYLPSRRWIDGSFSQDLPSKRLARMYGVNHFIVSQVMPVLGNESSRRPGLFSIMRDASTAASKQVVRGSFDFMQRYIDLGPGTATAINAINSLIDQSYSGDINIYPGFGLGSLAKILRRMSRDEVVDIIQMGERATWEKLATIETTTRVGRTLDRICTNYEAMEIDSLTRNSKNRKSRGVRKPKAA